MELIIIITSILVVISISIGLHQSILTKELIKRKEYALGNAKNMSKFMNNNLSKYCLYFALVFTSCSDLGYMYLLYICGVNIYIVSSLAFYIGYIFPFNHKNTFVKILNIKEPNYNTTQIRIISIIKTVLFSLVFCNLIIIM